MGTEIMPPADGEAGRTLSETYLLPDDGCWDLFALSKTFEEAIQDRRKERGILFDVFLCERVDWLETLCSESLVTEIRRSAALYQWKPWDGTPIEIVMGRIDNEINIRDS